MQINLADYLRHLNCFEDFDDCPPEINEDFDEDTCSCNETQINNIIDTYQDCIGANNNKCAQTSKSRKNQNCKVLVLYKSLLFRAILTYIYVYRLNSSY